MKTIYKYFDQVLSPFLRKFSDVSPLQEKKVLADIEKRLTSIFRNWEIEIFRKVILLPGIELAQFYQPRTSSLDAQTIVVVVVRNSLIEELHTIAPYDPILSAAARLTQEAMSTITNLSSIFFSREFESAINDLYTNDNENDIFISLSKKYPGAWRRMEAIAMSSRTEQLVPNIPENWHLEKFPESILEAGVVRLDDSGFRPEIDQQLGAILNKISAGFSPCFYTASFRTVSRNPEKLLRTIEHLLSCDKPFITKNYFISREYVSRRLPLVDGSSRNHKQSYYGLTKIHKDWLQFIHR